MNNTAKKLLVCALAAGAATAVLFCIPHGARVDVGFTRLDGAPVPYPIGPAVMGELRADGADAAGTADAGGIDLALCSRYGCSDDGGVDQFDAAELVDTSWCQEGGVRGALMVGYIDGEGPSWYFHGLACSACAAACGKLMGSPSSPMTVREARATRHYEDELLALVARCLEETCHVEPVDRDGGRIPDSLVGLDSPAYKRLSVFPHDPGCPRVDCSLAGDDASQLWWTCGACLARDGAAP